MKDRINLALAQLEKDLQKINSAKEQVESTVRASTDLQKVVSEYVSSVKGLCESLQSWDSDLRTLEGNLSSVFEETIYRVNSTCDEIVSSFGSAVEKSCTDFKDKTDNIIEKFTEQNTKLSEHVRNLSNLKEDVNKAITEILYVKNTLLLISENLKELQEKQDVELNDIKAKSEEVNTKVNAIASSAEVIQVKLDSITKCLNDGISLFDRKAETICSDLITLRIDSQSIISASSEIKSSLQLSTKEIVASINVLKTESAKSIKINRWILIVGFIVMVALNIVFKIL